MEIKVIFIILFLICFSPQNAFSYERIKKDKNLSFNVRLSKVIIEIDYIQRNKPKKKYIDFSFGYGD
jgi:hypothetical protein